MTYLHSPAAGQKPGLFPREDRGTANAQKCGQLDSATSALNQSIDIHVHGPIVKHSDIGCQAGNVRRFNTPRRHIVHTVGMDDRPPPPDTLGSRLRELRKKQASLTQEDVAAAVGVSRSYIAGIESGGAKPGRESLVALADFFEVSVDYLIKGGDPMPSQPPETSKFAKSPDELALLSLWRELDDGERRIILRLMRPPSD